MKTGSSLILYISLCLFWGCEPRPATNGSQVPGSPPQGRPITTPTENSTPSQPDTAAFGPAFNQFFQAIQQQDAATFNRFIHPEFGLYIYEQPGAVPHFTSIQDITQFKRHFQDRPFFSIRQDLQKCVLQRVESLPDLNCQGEEGNPAGYKITGCFLTDGTAFRQNEAYQYAPQPAEEKQQVKEVVPLVQKTVLHTGSNHKFHFGYLEGRWYVLFIDLMVPCSA